MLKNESSFQIKACIKNCFETKRNNTKSKSRICRNLKHSPKIQNYSEDCQVNRGKPHYYRALKSSFSVLTVKYSNTTCSLNDYNITCRVRARRFLKRLDIIIVRNRRIPRIRKQGKYGVRCY